MFKEGTPILVTRQFHQAKRAGDHYDIRLVLGDKAYSWATRKDWPKLGDKIAIYEQPVHTTEYALTKRIVIPKGFYGEGTTTLLEARKGIAHNKENFKGKFTVEIPETDERFLFMKFKKQEKPGSVAWLLKSLPTKKVETTEILEKVALYKEQPHSSELKPHQHRAIEKLLTNHGVILNHSTGSGKTRTILEAVKRIQEKESVHPNSKQLIITPASLTTNIDKELKKHKLDIDESRVETISYDKAINDIARLNKNNYSLVSVDEAHKLRNTSTARFKGLQELVENADYKILATATPIYNASSDVSPLVNLASGEKRLLPTEKKDFENRYIKKVSVKPSLLSQVLFGQRPEEKITIKNPEELKGILDRYMDTYDLTDDPNAKDYFPERIERNITVPMSEHQEKVYKYLEGDIPFLIRMKIRNNLPLDKKESAQLNAFATGVRQASNSIAPFVQDENPEISPKIETAVASLKEKLKADPNFKGLVYSNFLKAGLEDYSKKLTEEGINHVMYTGSLSKKDKDKALADYNAGKLKAMLISSSGAEGLDTKGTKLIQVLEPHFNNSKINQVIGRGVRYQSHAHLPKEERKVEVEHFLSTFRPGWFGEKKGKTIDTYLKENSLGKDEVVDKIKELLKT